MCEMCWLVTDVEFTGDLSLALDIKPVPSSPAPPDSLDITAEPAPADVSDRYPASSTAAAGPSLSTDQSLASLRPEMSKPSAAEGAKCVSVK